MAGESESKTYRWVLPLVVGVLCGGLGGSIFTYYMNRPKPTVVTYRIAETTLTAPEAAGLIPNLKVLIAGTPIQALYAHNVELLPREGPFVDQAEVALSFSSPVRIYGIHQETPSDLHHIECAGFVANAKNSIPLPDAGKEISSVQCTMRPVLFQEGNTHPFRVTMATDRSEVPRVVIAAKGIELVAADQFASGDQEKVSPLIARLLTVMAITMAAMTLAAMPLFLRTFRSVFFLSRK